MEKGYKPQEHWNERFRIYGHTGWKDRLIYAYDQPLRLKAIDKALARAKIPIDSSTNILDVGCGTGDLVIEFAKRGANVTGIDISSEVLEYAKGRLSNFDNVRLLLTGVEELNFTNGLFDLVTSVTVLQHITDQKSFSKAIGNIVRVTKPGGHILILETSPIEPELPPTAPYQAVRSRREWIRAFEAEGCPLNYELGLPQLGIRFFWR